MLLCCLHFRKKKTDDLKSLLNYMFFCYQAKGYVDLSDKIATYFYKKPLNCFFYALF